MVTFHPTAKRTVNGYIPMVTIRAARGRMVGSRVPQGEAASWHTYDTAAAAQCAAYTIALRVASRLDCVRVA